MFGMNDFIGAGSANRQALVEPEQNGANLRVQVPQALDQLHGERLVQRGFLKTVQSREDCRLSARTEQAIGQCIGFTPCRPAAYHALRHPAQIFHQHDAQRDRDCPEFSNRERLHALICVYKAAQRFRLKPAVCVSHKRPSDSENAGIALQMAGGKLGQLAVIALGQIVLDLAELFIDDVEVIDQPLCCRRYCVLFLNG